MFWTSVDEIHEASAAVELGQKDGGVSLRFGALDPLQAGPNAAVLAAPFSQDSASVTAHPHYYSLIVLDLSNSDRIAIHSTDQTKRKQREGGRRRKGKLQGEEKEGEARSLGFVDGYG